jgi:hypothetical protein
VEAGSIILTPKQSGRVWNDITQHPESRRRKIIAVITTVMMIVTLPPPNDPYLQLERLWDV